MKKRLAAMLLMAVMLISAAVPAWGDTITMYVYTENGKSLNVRSDMSTKAPVIGHIPFGGEVQTVSEHANHWMEILFEGKIAFVMSRYLVETKPKKKPKPGETPAPVTREDQIDEINKEKKTLKALDAPVNLVVRPSRPTGWVNFRVAPGSGASRIAPLSDGKILQATGETTNWYQATDPDTGKVGYVNKKFVTVQPAASASEKIGSLNVNGRFDLQCRMPEGYTLQVVTSSDAKVEANLNPFSTVSPVLTLTIAFDETYADVARMNDLSNEELAVLEESFREMNDVEISYTETSHGTKLLIAREVGPEEDFVDILSVYDGYFVEFVMKPNPNAADKTLTDAQVKMCVDFLSDVDFIPAA